MIIISLGRLDLGNNFSYSHYINALEENHIDIINSKEWDLDSNIKLIARGNYGKVSLNTCGSDLSDHIRGL
tara:strand:- start:1161 stop:1373 length:213 start_codon:yes stop_codon:yes gene_type:complete